MKRRRRKWRNRVKQYKVQAAEDLKLCGQQNQSHDPVGVPRDLSAQGPTLVRLLSEAWATCPYIQGICPAPGRGHSLRGE